LLLVVLGVLASPAATIPLAAQERAESHESGTGEGEAAHGGWAPTIAKAFNFAVLAGLLAYFLRTPVVTHLRTRSETIRKDLVDAAALRATAERQLAQVRERLATMPAEVEALRSRGADELAAERLRMAEATAREKQLVIERTRREIDVQFRVARRRLVAHTAELSIARARSRIERDITPDDQVRLIDRYAAEVRA
jgi:F-type H+-transporting ATPase subunit b